MKNLFILLILTASMLANAQAEQTQIPESESIVGIWRQTGIIHPKNGELIPVLSGNYKLINPDRTFFTFVTWGTKDPKKGTTIGQYGTYEIKTDSTLVENVIKHSMDPNLNGSRGTLRYELKNEKTLMMAWKNNMGNWVNEEWTRLPLSR
ncbi:protein of unknown function [Salegentibacter holothuriorum]|uniref:DUF4488 domain-containing protein n=1 Tax=Salegentibacter holothuriorum TaxID=241145 RepID=A0A1T5DG06_9FLAO|nr:DUF4488 domain-containing protein [Salegentibacter holothuriorum]SKB70665.1 protein of unknown function [Salegentibacter holothuriorum]